VFFVCLQSRCIHKILWLCVDMCVCVCVCVCVRACVCVHVVRMAHPSSIRIDGPLWWSGGRGQYFCDARTAKTAGLKQDRRLCKVQWHEVSAPNRGSVYGPGRFEVEPLCPHKFKCNLHMQGWKQGRSTYTNYLQGLYNGNIHTNYTIL
jgi:hypothetical protein